MRVLQLLAIAAVCPLVASAAGCDHIVQPVGSYETSQPVPLMHPTSAASIPDAHVRETSEPRSNSPLATGVNPAEPEPPSDPITDAAAPEDPPTPVVQNPPPTVIRDAGSTSTPITVPATSTPSSPVCTPTSTIPAQLPRFDAYIVMDANFALPITAGLWEFATTGVQDFWRSEEAQHLGLGLRFYGSDCDPNAYDDMPTVEIDLPRYNTEQMLRATSTTLNLNGSAMGPALRGGIKHQTTRAKKKDAVKQIVILLTDGFVVNDPLTPACNYTEAVVVDDVGKGFKQTPSVQTYVIGFGLPATGIQVADDIIARFLPLNNIATAGGSRSAQTLEFSNDSNKMTEALHKVRRDAQPAEFPLPAGVDRTKLGLVFDDTLEIPRIEGANICGQKHGWYFNPTTSPGFGLPAPAPTTAQLCPETQTLVEGHSAEFVVGCPPMRRFD